MGDYGESDENIDLVDYGETGYSGASVLNFLARYNGEWFLAVKNSSMGDLVTDLVSHSLRVLLLLTYKEEPWRLVTFETPNHIDGET